MSTPISHLSTSHSSGSGTVSKILDKYNSINEMGRNDQATMAAQLMPRPVPGGEIMELPPLDQNQMDMEERFENRDLKSYPLNLDEKQIWTKGPKW